MLTGLVLPDQTSCWRATRWRRCGAAALRRPAGPDDYTHTVLAVEVGHTPATARNLERAADNTREEDEASAISDGMNEMTTS